MLNHTFWWLLCLLVGSLGREISCFLKTTAKKLGGPIDCWSPNLKVGDQSPPVPMVVAPMTDGTGYALNLGHRTAVPTTSWPSWYGGAKLGSRGVPVWCSAYYMPKASETDGRAGHCKQAVLVPSSTLHTCRGFRAMSHTIHSQTVQHALAIWCIGLITDCWLLHQSSRINEKRKEGHR